MRPATGASSRSGRSSRSEGAISRVSAALSQTSRASEADFMRVPPRHRRPVDLSGLPPAGALHTTGLPGYTGYVPGKKAENVYGHTFQMSNDRAAMEVSTLRSGLRPRSTFLTTDGPSPGHEVPGYMGFCPGRHAANVFGQTQARSSETSFLVKGQQAEERRHRVLHYRNGQRPPTGDIDFAGYKSHGSIAHSIDARH